MIKSKKGLKLISIRKTKMIIVIQMDEDLAD